jgi:hypothetical protein
MSLSKLTFKGTCGLCYLSEAQNPVHRILIHTGEGVWGGVEPVKRGERKQFAKAGSKIPS